MIEIQKSFIIVFSVLVLGAGTAVAQPPGGSPVPSENSVRPPTAAPDESRPVAVPEPSAKAMAFYHSGNRLWVLNRVWAILLTGTLAFSGASARLRTWAQRMGRIWFFTVGLYVVMYLAVVFVIDLPLSFYLGYVRLHDYGLSNQTLAKWFRDCGDPADRGDGGRVRLDLGALSSPGPEPAPVVALHGAALGAVPVRDDAAGADLDRSAL